MDSRLHMGIRSGVALELEALHKRYGDYVAVESVDLRADPGEFLTLLGPSGSGKTTTLNMIAGFVTPSSGRIQLDGGKIDHLPPHKRNIGMVFQHYALFPHMTAFENVAFPLKQRKCGGAEIRTRVLEALELVGLGDRAHSYPRQLSGGQQQRVALARAIVFRPSLLLMDEPLGALDRQLREHMQMEIKRIHVELGITFVYVTHDQEEALTMSDRVAIFNNGRIEQVGTASDVYDRPRTLFAAEFLGESNSLSVARTCQPGIAVVAGLDVPVRLPEDTQMPAGDGATVVIRPERLRAMPAGLERSPGTNALRGVVQRVVYLGSARRVDVEVSPWIHLSVREQSGMWSPVQKGDAVDIGWHPGDSVLLEQRTAPAIVTGAA
ncbi:ABC transporter ATP-binding protein [Pseudaminobacter arsenicus]|uniref:Spermidine/putrescine import ATP-binding protein PotA n=1 Tax=Borborobacter arsenicus TaxID=1851146 RepID=A0A432V826_9HYPH|nr:ABC transporter ATP-binding protein [Pseudaminobacter arsenicus]RUM98280.1 ABC transporter ATP-binding protein [Pseudaminobacter arsenicus]